MLKHHKRNFKILIDDKSIWEHFIEQKHLVQSPPLIELENARIFCGLSIEQFEKMVGTNYWSNEETTLGIYESKSDVLVFYRSQKLTELILNQLSIKDIKK